MQKELLRDAPSELEIIREEKTFKRNKDIVDYLEGFLSLKKDKFHSLTLNMPAGGSIRAVGYGNATLIKGSECVAYACGKKAEFAFLWNFARDVCKQYGEPYFVESVLLEAVRDNSKLKKLPDSKFQEVKIIFSALNNTNVTLLPPQRAFVRMDNDTLKAFSNDCEEQMRCAALLTKLEKEGLPPNDAVRKVLEVSSTENFVKACDDFGFKVEKDLSSSFLEKERVMRRELITFLLKVEEGSLSRSELEENAKKIGVDVCELNIMRKIIKYKKEIEEEEASIESKRKYVSSLAEGVMKDQMKKDLDISIAYMDKKISAVKNMEKALDMIRELDESHKP